MAWALLVTELDEARGHIEELTDTMNKEGLIEESEYSAYLGHVYAHLNRAWHSRNQDGEITDEQWPVYNQFPEDVNPVG